MRSQSLTIAGSFLAIAAVCVLSRGQGAPASQPGSQPSSTPASPIPLSELRDRGIAGRLGPKLGTMCQVTGVVVQNKSNAKADVSEPFFLQINTIDGKKLEIPRLFSSSTMQLKRRVAGLKVGDTFDCIGYETGSYTGAPDGLFDHVESFATQGYFFEVNFVVVKVRKVQS